MKALHGERQRPAKGRHSNRGGHGGGRAQEMTPADYAGLEPIGVLFTMRCIATALVIGVVVFAGIASFVVFGQPPAVQPPAAPQQGAETVMYLAMIFAAVAVVLSFVVPNFVASFEVKRIAKMAQSGTSTGSKELFGR